MTSSGFYSPPSNKKKAKSAMSKAVILVFITAILSSGLNTALTFVLSNYSRQLFTGFVNFIKLFGITSQNALAVSKSFFASGIIFEFFGIVNTIVSMILPCVVFLKVEKIPANDTFTVKGRFIKHFFSMFCLCQLFNAFSSNLANSLYEFLIPNKSAAATYTAAEIADFSDAEIYVLLLSVLSTCILVPIAEEFMFRGVLFSLLRKFGTPFAIVATASLFGAAHSSPVQSVYAFSFGVFSALMVCITGNIKTGIVFHAMNNFITTMLEYVSYSYDEMLVNAVFCLYYALLFIFAFFGLFHLLKKDGLMDRYSQVQIQQDKDIASPPGTSQIFCIPFVIYLVIYGYETILSVI